jgi:small ligand-binding sensory domain FIST
MAYAAAISEHPVASTAVGEAIGQVLDAIGPAPDLAVLFVTGAHVDDITEIGAAVRTLLAPTTLIGSTTVSAIGGPQEIEERPAVSLWAGRTGPVQPVRLDAVRTMDGWTVAGLPDDVGATAPATVVLLADPYSFPVDAFVASLATARPQLTLIGGLASGGRGPGSERLVADGAIHTDGAVGVVLPPGLGTRVVVSQGCRPIGEPYVVTGAHDNLIEQLAGRPALERLQNLVEHASPDDRALLARGLHVGLVIDERKEQFTRGDFLVRNVVGADRSTGAVAIGDEVSVGTTVQFQVRDATTADEDLRLLLAGPPASAALVFTCNGRGARLFGQPDHDATLVHDAVGRGAVAGMFCAGEIGPIGARNFLHGFTASVLLFT